MYKICFHFYIGSVKFYQYIEHPIRALPIKLELYRLIRNENIIDCVYKFSYDRGKWEFFDISYIFKIV